MAKEVSVYRVSVGMGESRVTSVVVPWFYVVACVRGRLAKDGFITADDAATLSCEAAWREERAHSAKAREESEAFLTPPPPFQLVAQRTES